MLDTQRHRNHPQPCVPASDACKSIQLCTGSTQLLEPPKCECAACLSQRNKGELLLVVQDRAMVPSEEWRRQIQQVDAGVLHHLRTEVAGGFDEERFGARIGFGNLKQ